MFASFIIQLNIRRHSQVVRQSSAKALFPSSNLGGASTTSERTLLRSDFCLHKNQSHAPSFLLFPKKCGHRPSLFRSPAPEDSGRCFFLRFIACHFSFFPKNAGVSPPIFGEPCGRRIQLVGTNKFKKKTFSRNQNDTLNSTIKKLLSHKMIAVKIVGRDNI